MSDESPAGDEPAAGEVTDEPIATIPVDSAAPPAGPSPHTVLDEIVVTSQRRVQSLQDVPSSVSVFSQQRLEDSNIDDVTDYFQKTPNVSVGDTGFGRNDRKISIRGVTNLNFGGTQSAFAVYVDDFNAGAVNANLNLYDVERIEVLRGPQGTLFGRNAAAGAINLLTNKPTEEFDAAAEAGYASLDTLNARGFINLPVSDWLQLRLVGDHQQGDDLVFNLFEGAPNEGFDRTDLRGALRLTPLDALLIDVTAAMTDSNESLRNTVPTGVLGPDAALFGVTRPKDEGDGFYPQNRRFVRRDVPEHLDTQGLKGVTRARWEADAFDAIAVIGYAEQEADLLNDFDETSCDLFVNTGRRKYDTFSQELRFQSSGDAAAVEWLFGIFHTDETQDVFTATQASTLGGVIFAQGEAGQPSDDLVDGCPENQAAFPNDPQTADTIRAELKLLSKTTGTGVFGDLTWHVLDKLDLSAGLRYSVDEITTGFMIRGLGGQITEDPPDTAKFDDVSPRLALTYHWTRDFTLYGSAAKGFKAGGFNVNPPEGVPDRYEAEELWNYELGAKGALWDRRMRYSAAIFLADWTNQQATSEFVGQDGNLNSITDNAAAARTAGAEVEIAVLLLDGLALNLAVGYLDARFKDFPNASARGEESTCDAKDGVEDERCDLSGERIPGAPKSTISADLSYGVQPFGWFDSLAILEYSRRDSTHSTIQGLIQGDRFPFLVEAFDVWNFRYIISRSSGEGFRLSFFVENLLDNNYYTASPVETFGLSGVPVVPSYRRIGAQLAFRF